MTYVIAKGAEPRTRADAPARPAESAVAVVALRRLHRVADVSVAEGALRALLRRVARWEEVVIDLRIAGRLAAAGPELEAGVLVRAWGADAAGRIDALAEEVADALVVLGAVVREDEHRVAAWLRPLERLQGAAWVTRAELEGDPDLWAPVPLPAAGEPGDLSVLWSLLTSRPARTVLSVAVRPRSTPTALLAAIEEDEGTCRRLAAPRRLGGSLYSASRIVEGSQEAGRVAEALGELRARLGERLLMTRVLVAGEGRVRDVADVVAAHLGGTVVPGAGEDELALAETALREVDTVHPSRPGAPPLADVLYAWSDDEVTRAFRPPVFASRAVPGLEHEQLPGPVAARRAPTTAGDGVRLDPSWVARLPQPLAGPLIHYVKVGDPAHRTDALAWFFEDVAAWRSIVLAAPLGLEALTGLVTRVRRPLLKPSFGGWSALGEALVDHWSLDARSAGREAVQRRFASSGPVLLDALLSEDLTRLLHRAGALRNELRHQPVEALSQFEALLLELQRTWPDGLGPSVLHVSEQHADLADGRTTHFTRALDGGPYAFGEGQVELRARVPSGRCFLHEPGRTDALVLPPLLRVHAPSGATYLIATTSDSGTRFRRAEGFAESTTYVIEDALTRRWAEDVGRGKVAARG